MAPAGVAPIASIVVIADPPTLSTGVMHDRVDFLADQFFGRPAQHALGGRIDEGGFAVGVDAVDAFTGGAQDQLIFTFDILEHALDPLPGRNAAAHVVFGVGHQVGVAAL